MNIESHDPQDMDCTMQSQIPLSSLFYRMEDVRHDAHNEELKRTKGEYQFLYWE